RPGRPLPASSTFDTTAGFWCRTAGRIRPRRVRPGPHAGAVPGGWGWCVPTDCQASTDPRVAGVQALLAGPGVWLPRLTELNEIRGRNEHSEEKRLNSAHGWLNSRIQDRPPAFLIGGVDFADFRGPIELGGPARGRSLRHGKLTK